MEILNQHGPDSSGRATAPRFAAAVATHKGRRDTNADAALIDEAAGLYAVADGLGDAPRSRLAADKALAAVREVFAGSWGSHTSGARPVEEACERMTLGVEYAHEQLYAPWWAPEERMRTTFAGVVVCGERLVIGHVGDSRVYLLRTSKGRLVQETEDHTVLGEALRRGAPHDVAAALKGANKLTRVVGTWGTVEVRPFVRCWEPGDLVLLCTDGLSDWLDPEAMTEIALGAPDLGAATQRLVDEAIARGGGDNTTALLVGHA